MPSVVAGLPRRFPDSHCGIVAKVDAAFDADLDRASRGSSSTDAKARTRMYQGGVVVLEDFPVENISEHLKKTDAIIWVDLCAPMLRT